MAEITGCACGQNHELMPTDTDLLGFTYELVCREHKRHKPCRRCRDDLLHTIAGMTDYDDDF